MKKRIAFFDFDGTITTHDSMFEFIKFYKGNFRYFLGFAVNAFFIVAWKTGIISNQVAKEQVLTHFFKNTPEQFFQNKADEFAATYISRLVRSKALKEIERLKNTGAEVVIVSASAENWIAAWCREHGLQLLATRLAIKNGRLTGKIDGFNCHGTEKVNRIKAAFKLSEYDEIYCYGDTKGDKPMLGLATFSFYKPFR